MTDLKYGVVWLPEAGVVLTIGGIPGAPAGDVTGPGHGVLDTVMLGLLTANGPSTTRSLLLKVELKLKLSFEFGSTPFLKISPLGKRQKSALMFLCLAAVAKFCTPFPLF